MVIKKLNSVFSKHSRLLFGIFALLIIVAFTPGIMDGCNKNPSKEKVGTAFGEKVTYGDLSKFAQKIPLAFMLEGQEVEISDNNTLFYLYCMEKYAERIGITVSDKEIADTIKSLPTLQSYGKFDNAIFEEILKNYGEKNIEAAVRFIVMKKKLFSLCMTNIPNKNEVEKQYNSMPFFEFEVCVINPENFKVSPKKADLQKFYNENKIFFNKDGKQLTFAEAQTDVLKACIRNMQFEKANEFAVKTTEKLQKMSDRKAAAAEFANLKVRNKSTRMGNHGFATLAPGDFIAFPGCVAQVVRRMPFDEYIYRQNEAQTARRIMAEIQKQCKSDLPQAGK